MSDVSLYYSTKQREVCEGFDPSFKPNLYKENPYTEMITERYKRKSNWPDAILIFEGSYEDYHTAVEAGHIQIR